MDTWLAVASRRETREYADRELPEEVARRILDAGRLAGSAKNRQPWRFLVVESDGGARERLADAVYEPDNVRGAQARRRDRSAKASARHRPRRPEHAARRLERGRRLVPERVRRPGRGAGRARARRRTTSSRSCSRSATPRASATRVPAHGRGVERPGEPEAARRARRAALATRSRARACRSARPAFIRSWAASASASGRTLSITGCQSPSLTIRISAEKSRGRAHRRAEDRLPVQVERAHVERHLRPAGAAEDDEPAAPAQRLAASPARSSRPSRARRRPGRRASGPARPRCRARRRSAPSSLARSIFSCARRGDEHARARLGGELDGERRDAAAGAEDEHASRRACSPPTAKSAR